MSRKVLLGHFECPGSTMFRLEGGEAVLYKQY